MSDRDTHFQHAAHFLLQEMDKRRFLADDTSLQHNEMQTLIAQFAYDVVEHGIDSSSDWVPLDWTVAGAISQIPDFTHWPEQT